MLRLPVSGSKVGNYESLGTQQLECVHKVVGDFPDHRVLEISLFAIPWAHTLFKIDHKSGHHQGKNQVGQSNISVRLKIVEVFGDGRGRQTL